jgi:hypothetical protein
VITPSIIVYEKLLSCRYLAERGLQRTLFLLKMLPESRDILSVYVIKYSNYFAASDKLVV